MDINTIFTIFASYEPYMDAPRFAKQSLRFGGAGEIAAIYPAFG
jgi:hypothetical protein